MKYKLIAFVLALTVMSWAQSTTPTQTPAPGEKSAPADAKATCPCCDKMASADHEDAHACMHPKATAEDGQRGRCRAAQARTRPALLLAAAEKMASRAQRATKSPWDAAPNPAKVRPWHVAPARATPVPHTAAAVAISAENPLPTITPRPATELLTSVRSPGLTAGAFVWLGCDPERASEASDDRAGKRGRLSLCD